MALVQFRLRSNAEESLNALKEALKANSHIPKYLSGKKRLPRSMPGSYRLGSLDEAVIYVDLCGKCWKDTPGAIAWLQKAVE